jgi:hypothetical protein
MVAARRVVSALAQLRGGRSMYLADYDDGGLGKFKFRKLVKKSLGPLPRKRRRSRRLGDSDELDGLGKFKLKKLVKKVGKVAKKLAPIAAGFIPVVGGFVQSALETRAGKKAQKKADARAAAQEAAAAPPTSADVAPPQRAPRLPRLRALAPAVSSVVQAAVAARAAQADSGVPQYAPPQYAPPQYAPPQYAPPPSYAQPYESEGGAGDERPAKAGAGGMPPWVIPAAAVAAGAGLLLVLSRR